MRMKDGPSWDLTEVTSQARIQDKSSQSEEAGNLVGLVN